MSRFFVPKGAVRGNKVIIDGPEAHHILDVMRLGIGDEVTAFDGTGMEYMGKIEATGKANLIVAITEARDIPLKKAMVVTLAQAIPKKDKMDYIVEKATELGVHSIIPIQTTRSIVRLDAKKAPTRVERWRKISKEAAKQCGAQKIPVIEDISGFDDAVARLKDYDLKLMACLGPDAESLKDVLRANKAKSALIFIGPEGDFTEDEIRKASSGGARLISLGGSVLKSDTAGLAALAVINYEYDNWHK